MPAACGSILAEASALRLTARRTWRFFETFVTEADNMLPPDNFQEEPAPVVAHRTSPTNLGLLLLSTAAAREFGWIGTTEAVERLEATLATMERLQRFRGHFFNWYDTSDLRALEPRYVSTVDSGNLAGHLIALASACGAWRTRRAAKPDGARGAADALDLAREALGGLSDDRRTHLVTRPELVQAFDGLAASLSESPFRLDATLAMAATAVDLASTLASERDDPESADMLFWIEAAHRTIASHHRDAQTDGMTDDLQRRLLTVETSARAMANAMEFDFLFDERRRPLSIGFLIAEDRLDINCYDLLASEARLASFFAIASGDIPARHWFRLGREVTPVVHGAALISWSGSMFEYLMPSLVMRAPFGSLLEKTNRAYRPSSDPVRDRTRPAVGHLRVGLQRARQGIHLPVFELRRAGPRLQTRLEREPRDCALRHRPGRHGRSRGGLPPTTSGWPPSAHVAATASMRRSTTRRHACRTARAGRSCAPTWRTIRA